MMSQSRALYVKRFIIRHNIHPQDFVGPALIISEKRRGDEFPAPPPPGLNRVKDSDHLSY